MKFGVAQIHPVRGDILHNVERHSQFVTQASAHDADVVIFPELSLTGYEPMLADQLAMSAQDARLQPFQHLSDQLDMTLAIGVPTREDDGVCISLVIFQPHRERTVYRKKYLHEDEIPYFMPGENFATLPLGHTLVAPSICYELSVPEHATRAHQAGAELYIVSVSKSQEGVQAAHARLETIAETYALPVMLSNNIGPSDDFVGAGQSAVWRKDGQLLAQLGLDEEGILIFDIETLHVETVVI